jgi:hypothetical protein
VPFVLLVVPSFLAMQITEPVTMLTDYALAVENLLFSVSVLSRINSRNRVTALLLGLGFISGTIAAAVGGTYHGFVLHFGEAALRRLWNVTLLSIGAMGAFLGSAIHAATVRRQNGNWIVAAVALTVIGLGVQISGFRSHQHFNHNDIFHIIQIGAMYLFFRATRHLQDRAYSPR